MVFRNVVVVVCGGAIVVVVVVVVNLLTDCLGPSVLDVVTILIGVNRFSSTSLR